MRSLNALTDFTLQTPLSEGRFFYMPISMALEVSAIVFNNKYASNFDFQAFESKVEEFTFFRPNYGWLDVYKTTFNALYRKSLENAAMGKLDSLNGEAMLDDYEYMLIRPYVSQCGEEIKHKPYAGMDRIARLEHLEQLTRETPSDLVALYAEQYKSGELTLEDMRIGQLLSKNDPTRCVEIAGYVQALEAVNRARSVLWRILHPVGYSLEKKTAADLKKRLTDA